jgi:hypothetical protein
MVLKCILLPLRASTIQRSSTICIGPHVIDHIRGSTTSWGQTLSTTVTIKYRLSEHGITVTHNAIVHDLAGSGLALTDSHRSAKTPMRAMFSRVGFTVTAQPLVNRTTIGIRALGVHHVADLHKQLQQVYRITQTHPLL